MSSIDLKNASIKNYFRIGLYGDSLSLARPNVIRREERYFYLLQKWIKEKSDAELETLERSKASVTITELYDWLHHDNVYYNWPGDLFILHCGIVDAAPRPITAKRREQISKLPSFIKKIVVKYIHKKRAQLINKHGGYFVTPMPIFKEKVNQIVEVASKTYNRLYIINICPTNASTENRSPGLSKSISSYNNLINECIREWKNSNIHLVDIHQLISNDIVNIHKYICEDDGHHITPLTHRHIFETIVQIENSID